MKVLIASSEAAPFVKTGGLADVTGSLLKEFRKSGRDASMIIPLYDEVRKKSNLSSTGVTIKVPLGGRVLDGEVFASGKSADPEAFFIACDELYGRPELYGTAEGDYPDNARRFIFFSRGVLETCIVMNLRPDVIHCNDWQTGMIPLYLKTIYKGHSPLERTATLYTIHNMGYAGLFSAADMKFTGLGMEYFTPERLEYYGKLNFMKAGILYADIINSVSMTYAQEILQKESGFGLDGVLRTRKKDLYGVLNGIDYTEWDPSRDGHLPHPYTPGTLPGKQECKKELMRKTGLKNVRRPLLGIVSRLASQKGPELIIESLEEFFRLGVNLAILGKGEDSYQKILSRAAEKNSGRMFVNIGFEESLAHLIYAGSDFFLMPSKYEPCGLGQLIAMKYGSIPVARRTGGLADTVKDYNHVEAEGTGFLFTDYSAAALQDAVKRALCVYTDKKKMRKLIADAMKSDFSWGASAGRYLELYDVAMAKVIG